MDMVIKNNESDKDIQDCFPVMSQLRPHLIAEQFVAQVREQMRDGYRLACVIQDGEVVAVAGYRISRCLSWGKYLYVDDLVTDAARRSQGFGKVLLAWLVEEARHQGCQEFHLDSGVQRKDAHRFYAREGMALLAYHYKLAIE